MSSWECARWRGQLGLAAIGRLEPAEQRELDAHLADCTLCQAELVELQAVGKTLELADPVEVDPGFASAPPARPDPVPAGAWVSRNRPRLRWALGGVGVAAVLAGAVGLWLLGPFSSPGVTVSLQGSRAVQATAVLTPEHWGTDLSLQVAGQPAGRVYRVSMQSRSGVWWQAGSYRSEPGSVHVELACGVRPSQVDRIWIEDSSGRVVLYASVS